MNEWERVFWFCVGVAFSVYGLWTSLDNAGVLKLVP